MHVADGRGATGAADGRGAAAGIERRPGKSGPRLVLLTLEKHQDGIWIRRLVERLRQSSHDSKTTNGVVVEVRAIEQWLSKPWNVAGTNSSSLPSSLSSWKDHNNDVDIFDGVVGIVNRVSDAAPPALFKACCALLHSASKLRKIPVWNGPIAYGLCANKWCHHVIFDQAGLSSPHPTTFQYHPDDGRALNIDKTFFPKGSDVLIKPNAAGFGNGIERITVGNHDNVSKCQSEASSFDDGIVVVQTYVPPSNSKIYRVWFLNGKVQCAVERTIKEESLHNNSQFVSGCAAGVCSFPPPRNKSAHRRRHDQNHDMKSGSIRAWMIPTEVKQEVEKQLLPLFEDCHCGSVEFLYGPDNDQRLYFDLNLLSTLPIMTDDIEVGAVSDDDLVWNHGYDPWLELAKAIWDFVLQ